MRVLGWAALLTLAGVTAIGFLGRTGYPAELFSHFRPHYATAALIGAGLAAALRFRWLALAGVAAFLANVAAIVIPLAGGTPTLRPSTDPHLTVIWANLQGNPAALDAVARLAAAEDADAVALTELPVTHGDLGRRFPHLPCLERPSRAGTFAVIWLTRGPCAGGDTASQAFWPWAARLTTLETASQPPSSDGRTIALAALHPRPPIGSEQNRYERDHVIQAAVSAAQENDAALLIGDFNATPWSPVMADLVHAGFRPVDCGAPWRSTWLSRAPFMGLPIDLAYAGPSVTAARCRVGPDIGSDHWPLIVALRLADE